MVKQYIVARELASCLAARENCVDSGNNEWYDKWDKRIDWITEQFLPSGSGIDCGTKIDLDHSTPTKLVLTCEYHHMNENGMYDGWTHHIITVTPTFDGIAIKVGGRDRNDIKCYLGDIFHECLSQICREMDCVTSRNEYGYYFQGKWHPVDINAIDNK